MAGARRDRAGHRGSCNHRRGGKQGSRRILALGAAIVSGVLTFMKPERTAEQHLAAGRQLAALRVHARQVLNLDLPQLGTDKLRKAIDEIATKKVAIDDAAPGSQGRDYNVARGKITKGTFDRDR